VDCVYPLYVATYEAVADAMRQDDLCALRSIFLAASFLAGPAAVAVAAAQLDAANGMPMCAKAHVCRLLKGQPCASACPQSLT
jgi:hypothetical protein